MVQALRGSNNLAVTGHPPKDRAYSYELGNEPPKIIHKELINGCTKAWRFSTPQISSTRPSDGNARPIDERLVDDHLLGFYDFLAMVQTECFMSHSFSSKPIFIPDSEMKVLEWLHEEVRNSIEHFVPKSYLLGRDSLVLSIRLCIKYSSELFFRAGTILLLEQEGYVKSKMSRLCETVAEEMPCPDMDAIDG